MVKACHLHNSGNELSFRVATLQIITLRLPVYRFNALIMGSLGMTAWVLKSGIESAHLRTSSQVLGAAE
jgi:hypothetical protein